METVVHKMGVQLPSGGVMNNPDAWTPKHTQILLMHSEGKTPAVIAREVGEKLTVVKRVINSKNLQKNLLAVKDTVVQTVVSQRMEMMNSSTLKEARKLLEGACVQATANLILMANSPDAKSRIQLEACKDILDRTGLKPLIVTESRERDYSPAEVASAKKILEEAQEIVKRLSNETSPFILGDTRGTTLVSSDTDKAQ